MKRNLIIIAVTAAALLTVILLALKLHLYYKEAMIGEFSEHQLMIAKQLAGSFERQLQDDESRLRMLIHMSSLQALITKRMPSERLLRDDVRLHMGISTEEPNERAMLVCDATGKVVFSTDEEDLGLDYSSSDFFQWAKNPESKDKDFVSNIVKNPAREEHQNPEIMTHDGEQMSGYRFFLAEPLYFSEGSNSPHDPEAVKPLRDNEKFRGVIALKLDLVALLHEHSKDFMATMMASAHQIWVIDGDGTLLYHPTHPEMVSRNILQADQTCFQCHINFDHVKSAIHGESGALDYRLKDQPLMQANFARMKFANVTWSFVVNTPNSGIVAFASKSLQLTLMLLAMVALIILAAAAFVYRNYRLKVRAEEEIKQWKEKAALEEKARETEEKYRRLVEFSPDAIAIHSGGKFQFINRAGAKLIGAKKPEDLIGKPIMDILHPDCRDKAKQRVRQVLEEGKEASLMEEKFIRLDGKIIDVETAAIPFEYQGQVAVQVVVRDISGRKRAETRLAQLNECFLGFGTDPRENINRLTAYCGELMSATCALYNRLDRDTLCVWGQWNAPNDLKRVDAPEGHICFDIISAVNDELHVIRDLPSTPYAQTDPNVSKYGLMTYIGKAVKFRDHHVGALCVVYQNDYVPGEDDRRILNVIAAAIGIEEERREAEEELSKLRLGMERTDDAIFITDKEGVILDVNPAFEKIYGYTRAETLGKTPRILKSDVHPKAMYEEFWGKLLAKQVVQIELFNKAKDGRLIAIEATANPILDAAGCIVGFMGIQRDVSARKQAEEDLRENEARYRSLFEHMLNGFAHCRMIFDGDRPQDFIYLAVNSAFETLTGLKDVVGRKATEVIPGIREADPELFEMYGRVARTGVPEKFEIYVAALKMWFAISVYSPSQDHFAAVFDVITERKQAEDEQRDNERFLSTMFGSIQDGICVMDDQCQVVRVNPTMQEWFADKLPLVGKKCNELYHPEDLTCRNCPAALCLRTGESAHQVYPLTDPEKKIVGWLERFSFPMVDPASGKITGVIEYLRNITERRRAEQIRDALYRIGDCVSTTENLNELLRGVHASISTVMYAENCYIALYDPETEMVSFPLFADQYDPAPAPRAKRRGFTEYMLRSGKPLLMTAELYAELVQAQEVTPIGTPPVSYLGVPLFIEGNPIGALVVQSYEEGHTYTGRDQDLLTAIGHQAALAIERKRKDDALRLSEQKYRMLIDNIQDGIFILQDLKLLYVNESFARTLGYTNAELLNARIEKLVAPEDSEMVLDRARRRLQGEDVPKEYEFRALHKDGKTRIHLNMTVGLINYHGRPASLGTTKDVTERKRAEREKEIIQNINQLLLGELDAERAIGEISGALRELIAHDLVALSIIQKESDQVEFILARPPRASSSEPGETTVLHFLESYQHSLTQQILFGRRDCLRSKISADATKFEQHLERLGLKSYVAVPLINAGVPLGMIYLASEQHEAFTEKHRHVLELIQSQLALYVQHHRLIEKMIDSEAKYRSLFENSSDAIYILQDKRFVFVNRKFEELLGYKLDEASQPDFDFIKLVAPESRALVEERARRKAAGENLPSHYEFKGLCKSGKILDFDVNVSYISYDGKTGVQGILRDISERKRFEQQQQEMQLELIQHAKLSSIGMLSAGIAHNMNVPLQGIINHIELLKMTRTDVPYLDDLLTQAQRIAAIINNMLFKSRQEQDQGWRELDLNQLLVEELTFLNADLEFKHRVAKDYQFDSNLPTIRGIYGDFSQALLNIIRNALDSMHSAKEKKLTVKTRAMLPECIVVEIADTGCGIPEEHLKQIFNPFFSTKPANGKQNGGEPAGTGLGLSSAHQLLKKYRARYDIKSELNQGTVFRVYIPLTQERQEAGSEEMALSGQLR